jgi:hypothetical protein
VPYYARLPAPAVVVSDWLAPDVPLRDNWRKELFDATRFSPDRGASVLWNWSRLPELPCTRGRLWVLAGPAQRARLAGLDGLGLVREVNGVQLLRAEGRDCAAAR